MTDLSSILTAALTAGFVSALIQVSVHRREARTLRAHVLTALADVEEARWAGAASENFNRAARALERAGLISGARRDVVLAYLAWATVALWESRENAETHGADDSGYIENELSETVHSYAQLVSDVAWRPWRLRFQGTSRLDDLYAIAISSVKPSTLSDLKKTPWSRTRLWEPS